MNVIPLMVAVSLGLVAMAMVLLYLTLKNGEVSHQDELSLAPLEDEVQVSAKGWGDGSNESDPSSLEEAS